MAVVRTIRFGIIVLIVLCSTISFAGDYTEIFSWIPNPVEDGVVKYEIHCGENPGGPYSRVFDVGLPNISADGRMHAYISGLSNNDPLYCVCVAINSADLKSDGSNEASVEEVGLLNPILNSNSAVATGNFWWSPIDEASRYQILYGTTSGGPYTGSIDVDPTPSEEDGMVHGVVTGFEPGTTYYFVFIAYDSEDIVIKVSKQTTITVVVPISNHNLAPIIFLLLRKRINFNDE